MRLALLACLLVACSGPRRWTKTDVGLEAAFLVEDTIDGLQSRKFVASCHEENPVIGGCGQRLPLGLYIPLTALLHVGIAEAIPHGTWRTIFLAATAGAELDTIYANQFLLNGH